MFSGNSGNRDMGDAVPLVQGAEEEGAIVEDIETRDSEQQVSQVLRRAMRSTPARGAAAVLLAGLGALVARESVARTWQAQPAKANDDAIVGLAGACVKAGSSCKGGDTCCGSSQCWVKNDYWAACQEKCYAGWSCNIIAPDGNVQGPPPGTMDDLEPEPGSATPAAAPSQAVSAPSQAAGASTPASTANCAWEGSDCSQSKCCRRVGYQCFEKQPNIWASCSNDCGPLKASGGDWTCNVLGGDQGIKQIAPAAPGEEAGTSLFCFTVVTADASTAPGTKPGYETDLIKYFEQSKVGICKCDAWHKYEGRRVETGDWSSVVNTDIFMEIWDRVRVDGVYKQHDFTVKVDADAVFFPERLKAHLKGLRPPKDTAVYFHNIDFKFKFQGAIEVLSTKAVDAFIDNAHECAKHLGTNGGEDLFTMQCLDAIGVGYMEDFKLLYDKYTMTDGWNLYDVDPCLDQDLVALHPYKAQFSWEGCFKVAMHMVETSTFVGCDFRFPGDACSMKSTKRH